MISTLLGDIFKSGAMSLEFKAMNKYIQRRRSFDVSSGCRLLTILKNFLSALLILLGSTCYVIELNKTVRRKK